MDHHPSGGPRSAKGADRRLRALVLPPPSPPRSVLKKLFDEVRVVDVLDSKDTAHLAMMKRPDLGVTFTKLHCWTLTHYSKCVFMDADTLVGHRTDILEYLTDIDLFWNCLYVLLYLCVCVCVYRSPYVGIVVASIIHYQQKGTGFDPTMSAVYLFLSPMPDPPPDPL